mmetsp:Transcript_10080/g.24838  ORF Transcript_10080/g.24838 Transcript_10080/m.24838 type:complete len:148 (-) Transcript_10080:140-583(-)
MRQDSERMIEYGAASAPVMGRAAALDAAFATLAARIRTAAASGHTVTGSSSSSCVPPRAAVRAWLWRLYSETEDATDSSNPNRVLQGLQEAKAGRVRGKARELMRQMRTRVRELDGRNQELRKALLEAVEARTKQKILQQGASIQAA